MSDKTKFFCFAGFAVLVILWFVLVLCGLTPAGELVSFIHTGLLALGSAILALVNPGSLSARITGAQGPDAPGQPITGSDKTGGFARLGLIGLLCTLGLAALVLFSLPGCASWNAGVSAANNYTAGELRAQAQNIHALNDNIAAAWAAAGCALPYGEIVRNGSGNPRLAEAVVALCGAPSGMVLLRSDGHAATYLSGALNATAGGR